MSLYILFIADRTEMAYCLSDVEFLAKLHGVRLAFEVGEGCGLCSFDLFLWKS